MEEGPPANLPPFNSSLRQKFDLKEAVFCAKIYNDKAKSLS